MCDPLTLIGNGLWLLAIAGAVAFVLGLPT